MTKFTFLLLGLISIYCNAQNKSTTIEEYDYLTKGLKIQKDSGLYQFKKGYTLLNLATNKPLTTNNYSFIGKIFKENSTKEVKAILIIMTSKKSNIESYFVIPFKSNECYQKYLKSLSFLDNIAREEFIQALSYFLMLQNH